MPTGLGRAPCSSPPPTCQVAQRSRLAQLCFDSLEMRSQPRNQPHQQARSPAHCLSLKGLKSLVNALQPKIQLLCFPK